MGSIWYISDTHFHHANILKFKNSDGSPVRTFSSVEEMNERMIEAWNSVVKDGDKVYHLGDVSFTYGPVLQEIFRRLRGKKHLIVGNHDRIFGTNLISLFEKSYVSRVFRTEGFMCTHIPIHPGSFTRCPLNVHGHLHFGTVKKDQSDQEDKRYFNVSVERVSYTPVALETLAEMAKALG